MTITEQIAKHVREVHFGGNWTDSCLREQLKDISWQEAVTRVQSLNSIAALVFHVNYYIAAVIRVLENQPLSAKDALSFDHPPIRSQKDWEGFLDKIWNDAERFAVLIENFPDDQLMHTMDEEKYGSFFRNFIGIIEHFHYHLGQIVLIKKILRKNDS